VHIKYNYIFLLPNRNLNLHSRKYAAAEIQIPITPPAKSINTSFTELVLPVKLCINSSITAVDIKNSSNVLIPDIRFLFINVIYNPQTEKPSMANSIPCASFRIILFKTESGTLSSGSIIGFTFSTIVSLRLFDVLLSCKELPNICHNEINVRTKKIKTQSTSLLRSPKI